MLQLTPQSRIFLAIEPIDFRCGIDGIAQICRQHLNLDPFAGALMVFSNRSGTAIKILVYDGQGFWLCMKRFSRNRLRWWPKSADAVRTMNHRELQLLLWNGSPDQVCWADDWRSVA